MGEEVTVEYDSPAIMKLKQAAKHFRELEVDVDTWNRENTILAPTRCSASDAHKIEVFMPTEPKPPLLLWSSRLGDGVHNLRASLDLLAFELCHLDGQAPEKPNKVYFPIVEEEKDWIDKTRHLGSIPTALLDRINKAQPWHAANPKTHLLTLIHALDIQDKHRYTVDIIVLPALSPSESPRPWPDGERHEKEWTTPWMTMSLNVATPSDLGPALWKVGAWPVVHFEGRIAPLPDLQRWLHQETYGIIEFIASGTWPELSDSVPEPSWLDLPTWGAQPHAGDS